MITPINDHILIEPVVHEGFMASQKETYEEIGIVIAVPGGNSTGTTQGAIQVGCKVYFDSWMAAKYPRPDGEFYWLVKSEDIRAVDYD